MAQILLVQIGAGFRAPNKHLIKHLQTHFPTDEVELVDLLAIVRKNPFIVLSNAFAMLWEYSHDFLNGTKKISRLHHYYLGTSYIFKIFSRIVTRKVESGSYKFIIQTQGLCDSSNSLNIPFFIYTDHTNLNNLNYQYVKGKLSLHSGNHQTLEKAAYDHARLVFVMSNNILESMVSQYHIEEDKIKLVYAGSNTPLTKVDNLQRYHSKHIVFVGKDWERKGGPLLVEAFNLVRQSIPEATLSIVGCKPQLKVNNCKIYGEVSLEEVSRIYSNAAVFCMPTILEPFGIVFLEAMVNCLPIVTNDIGATADFVIDDYNGYRLHNDVHEYAQVLIKLLLDPEKCKTFGNNSGQIVNKHYTWENVTSLMAQHIKESI
jgi:glycosyltransferase involved in cell wall biosynthesis